MIVFHASTVKINDFYIPYGGLHFGGMMSAVECALRKLYSGRDEGHEIDSIHIHRCLLKSTKPYEGHDEGSDSNWRNRNALLIRENVDFDCIKYINKYEPDILPSYCLFRTDIVQILDCSTMHMDLAEDLLNGNYQDEYRYSLG